MNRITDIKSNLLLTPSVLGRTFIFTLTFICRFYTASETPVGIEIVQTLVINLLTSIDLLTSIKSFNKMCLSTKGVKIVTVREQYE